MPIKIVHNKNGEVCFVIGENTEREGGLQAPVYIMAQWLIFVPPHIFARLFVRSLIHSIWAIVGHYSTELHYIIHHYTILCQ